MRPWSIPDAATSGQAIPQNVQAFTPHARCAGAIVLDPRIRILDTAIKKASWSDGNILLIGESGTGKELVARALHRSSPRATGRLLFLNCTGLVETQFFLELFGHEKGAFAGATARRRGRLELADGGTLLLDEIGDLSPAAQVALLRVLQEKTFERIGGTRTIRTNARLICTTHRDLRAMVDRGEFREDLYQRLSGITLEVPPLRERPGDIPLLAEHLLARLGAERGESTKTLTSGALELLVRYRWPGNVRELENVLRTACVLAEGDAITLSDLLDVGEELRGGIDGRRSRSRAPSSRPRALGSGEVAINDDLGSVPPAGAPQHRVPPSSSVAAVAYGEVRQHRISLYELKRSIERYCIIRALDDSNGNITHAAALLGMKRPRLSQLIRQYDLSVAPRTIARD